MKEFKKMIIAILTILTILFIALFFYAYRWNILNPNKSGSIKVENLDRTFIYHVPKILKPNPKLIIVYHGSTLKAFMMQIFSGHEFDLLADKSENTIIVYPQGYKEQWNDCRKNAPYDANKLNIDDVTFTEQIIAYFKSKYQINEKGIFAVGYSNGGGMVTRLAYTLPDIFKSYAIISNNLPVAENCICNEVQKPVSIIYFSGVKDHIVPFDGGEAFVNGISYGFGQSTEQTLKHWLSASFCHSTASYHKDFKNKNGDITAIQTNYNSTSTSKKITFVKLLDGGHTIPNRNFRIPIKALGNMNAEVDAPQLIWGFFMN